MRFTIPQFIEHTPKIIGPLTFKQFLFIGGAGAICFLLYFLLPFFIFAVLSIILVGGGIAMAFFKLNGKPVPLVLLDFLKFGFESKVYIWQKKNQPMVLYRKKEESSLSEKLKQEKKDFSLKIGGKSRLKKMHNKIETNTK